VYGELGFEKGICEFPSEDGEIGIFEGKNEDNDPGEVVDNDPWDEVAKGELGVCEKYCGKYMGVEGVDNDCKKVLF
jgi:hypothetical protein